jgi:general secretion pathway protein C
MAQAGSTYIAGRLEAIPQGLVSKQSRIVPPIAADNEEAGVEDYQVIVARNIFNSAVSGVATEATDEELSAEQLGELGPAIKTGLDIKVLGTLMVGDGTDSRSSTTISGGKSKGADVYYPGDEKTFAPNVKLTKVDVNRIEFINGGHLEYAELVDFTKKSIFLSAEEVHGTGKVALGAGEKPAATDAGPSDASKIVVDQREVDDALQNLDKLMTEVRITPNFQDGRSAGMKVLSIKPGSVIAKLGIRRGDVLQKVNGQDLDMRQGMELFSQMKDMKNFSLDVVRGGKNQTLEYEIR